MDCIKLLTISSPHEIAAGIGHTLNLIASADPVDAIFPAIAQPYLWFEHLLMMRVKAKPTSADAKENSEAASNAAPPALKSRTSSSAKDEQPLIALVEVGAVRMMWVFVLQLFENGPRASYRFVAHLQIRIDLIVALMFPFFFSHCFLRSDFALNSTHPSFESTMKHVFVILLHALDSILNTVYYSASDSAASAAPASTDDASPIDALIRVRYMEWGRAGAAPRTVRYHWFALLNSILSRNSDVDGAQRLLYSSGSGVLQALLSADSNLLTEDQRATLTNLVPGVVGALETKADAEREPVAVRRFIPEEEGEPEVQELESPRAAMEGGAASPPPLSPELNIPWRDDPGLPLALPKPAAPAPSAAASASASTSSSSSSSSSASSRAASDIEVMDLTLDSDSEEDVKEKSTPSAARGKPGVRVINSGPAPSVATALSSAKPQVPPSASASAAAAKAAPSRAVPKPSSANKPEPAPSSARIPPPPPSAPVPKKASAPASTSSSSSSSAASSASSKRSPPKPPAAAVSLAVQPPPRSSLPSSTPTTSSASAAAKPSVPKPKASTASANATVSMDENATLAQIWGQRDALRPGKPSAPAATATAATTTSAKVYLLFELFRLFFFSRSL